MHSQGWGPLSHTLSRSVSSLLEGTVISLLPVASKSVFPADLSLEFQTCMSYHLLDFFVPVFHRHLKLHVLRMKLFLSHPSPWKQSHSLSSAQAKNPDLLLILSSSSPTISNVSARLMDFYFLKFFWFKCFLQPHYKYL